MTAAATPGRLPASFRHYPGAVLRLDAGGFVLDSNGRLERELARELVGHSFAEVVDAESSLRKLQRILALRSAGADQEAVWELILAGGESLPEPRTFSAFWDDDAHALWLLEHRLDPRAERMREQVEGVNSELANAQRELLKERGRLANALAEREALTRTIQAQNAELERSNGALDEFAHVVSHDLKAPLRGISNYAEWLARDLGDALPPESRDHLARLRDRVGRMGAMIQGVLEYARAGRELAQPERVDLRALVRDALELLDPPPGAEIEVDPEMPVLLTERAPLQQVLLNLIANALRHARPDDPRVRVDAREAGEFWEISVSDNGPGVPERMKERIWALFHTGDEAGGTGIGLAVVKKLVEARGGRAWVEAGPAGGALFRFLWPTRSESPLQDRIAE